MLSREQWLGVLENGLERVDPQDLYHGEVEITDGYRVAPQVPVLRAPAGDGRHRAADDDLEGRPRRPVDLRLLRTITVAFEAVTQHPGGLPYLERAQGVCIVAEHPALVLISAERKVYIPWEAIVFIEA